MAMKSSNIIELFSIYSERSLAMIESSLQFQREKEKMLLETNSIKYAKQGVVYVGGVAIADLNESIDQSLRLSENENNALGDEDDICENSSGGESDSASSSDNHLDQTARTDQEIDKPTKNSSIPPEKLKMTRKSNTVQLTNKQHEQVLRKYWETMPVIQLPVRRTVFDIENKSKRVIELPSGILAADELKAENSITCYEEYRNVLIEARKLVKEKCSIIVLFIRSGRFAGAVFGKPTTAELSSTSSSSCCLSHRTSVRYTVRKGQGKAQSSQDNQRRPKSMGAQLRRAGEINLQADIAKTIFEWKRYFEQATLILLSVPKTMQKSLFEGTAVIDGGGTVKVDTILSKFDPRIRRVPLDMGRPSYESVCMIHSIMTTGVIREQEFMDTNLTDKLAELNEKTLALSTNDSKSIEKMAEETGSYPPLNPMHIAAQSGDITQLRSIIESSTDSVKTNEWKNQQAGESFMTPLHIAAESTSHSVDATLAAECVTVLLVEGRCNPCMMDGRNRVPYYLASHEKVRESFRMARASLGEAYCEWDTLARVGPPLTKEDIQLKKEKDAEKKRKKRLRMKAKKDQELAKAAELAEIQKKEEERRQQAEDAKRIRDGLQPKLKVAPDGIACDFCQTICYGNKRFDMFKRLDYSYCSIECVQKHKRELMANAALARFQ